MSKPKYLYIDDENGTSEVATLHGFNDVGLVSVERFPLKDFKEFSSLKQEIVQRSKTGGFDGLIIDLRIDGTGEDRTEFNASSISQELRSVAARQETRSYPIVLCSTEEKIRQTYSSDKTSHDLFDYKISKSNASPQWEKLSQKLYTLAIGYAWLQEETRTADQVIGKDLNLIDDRIEERIRNLNVNYDYAHFVIKNFFHQTNPLINEKIFAARVGVDLQRTEPAEWGKLISGFFQTAKYSGLFSDGWNRWWADDIAEIFEKNTGEKLAFTNANKRIEILNGLVGTNLIPAEPLKYCNSSEFWTICEGFKTPLDPLEGYRICTSVELKPWQESKYLSLLAILERKGFTDRGLQPHPSELERINYAKELLGL